ncbi:Putative odorant-binding protein A10 [Frankliniella fusca]|uniref:Odorant-binding protein A10 n=1 Tax=Frankliniella fusca TaxID=407009 RepID=A0AAE1LH68_9NEOP|nr:Putative odorant-binding protein A10 [Frankliniella fusca]
MLVLTLVPQALLLLAGLAAVLAAPAPGPQPVPYPVAYPGPNPYPVAHPYPYPVAAPYPVARPAPAPGPAPQNRPPVSDTALENALGDRRYLQRQLKCALGEAPCDPVGRRLKTLAPLVLRGACPQCSPQETRQIQKVLSHVQRNYPREWSKLLREYAG